MKRRRVNPFCAVRWMCQHHLLVCSSFCARFPCMFLVIYLSINVNYESLLVSKHVRQYAAILANRTRISRLDETVQVDCVALTQKFCYKEHDCFCRGTKMDHIGKEKGLEQRSSTWPYYHKLWGAGKKNSHWCPSSQLPLQTHIDALPHNCLYELTLQRSLRWPMSKIVALSLFSNTIFDQL
jgi:hypothetical protein